jgi:hypothetical protein
MAEDDATGRAIEAAPACRHVGMGESYGRGRTAARGKPGVETIILRQTRVSPVSHSLSPRPVGW